MNRTLDTDSHEPHSRYANRAKNIKNKPKINEDPKDAMLREFQEHPEPSTLNPAPCTLHLAP